MTLATLYNKCKLTCNGVLIIFGETNFVEVTKIREIYSPRKSAPYGNSHTNNVTFWIEAISKNKVATWHAHTYACIRAVRDTAAVNEVKLTNNTIV